MDSKLLHAKLKVLLVERQAYWRRPGRWTGNADQLEAFLLGFREACALVFFTLAEDENDLMQDEDGV